MWIRFQCPFCSTLLRAKESSSGKRGRCTSCHHILGIPNQGNAVNNSHQDLLQQTSRHFATVRLLLEQQLPAGFKLNEKACISALGKVPMAGMTQQELVRGFSQAIMNHPERYIEGYRELLQKRAGEIFKQIEKSLISTLPTGCCLKHDICIETIKGLIKKGVGPDKLMKEFTNQIQSKPGTFINNYQEFLHERASEIFKQIEKGLSSAIPAGYLERDFCIEYIERLIEEGLALQELMKEFMERLISCPAAFVKSPAFDMNFTKSTYKFQNGSPYSSGSPYMGGRSEIL